MTTTTPTHRTTGHRLAAQLAASKRKPRRARPRSKRSTTKRQAKRKTPRKLSPLDTLKAELRAAPGGQRALALINAEGTARLGEGFSIYNHEAAQRGLSLSLLIFSERRLRD